MVQIKNRTTGYYDKKGQNGWSDKMHQRGAWGSITQAKSHIALSVCKYYINDYKAREYLDSDFIIVDDNYNVSLQPVSDYLIPKMEQLIKEYTNKAYRQDELKVLTKLVNEFKANQI